ncbi:hypothetical protein ACIRQP_14745 [Streptomyces sp. NPDC102274]|uniref:hypothetical protein n=1 Tax=Streptomyces sp. NPDC102274 TaxID=3366151 RepID=UPI0037FD1E68
MSARETLHSDLLTTPTAAALPHPEGWASIRIERYRDEVRAEVLAEAKAEIVAWLVKKAHERTDIGVLASKVDRGAVRIFLGTGHFQDARDAHRAEVLREATDMLTRVGHPAAALILRYADEPGEKASTSAVPTATPQPDPANQWTPEERQHRLLIEIHTRSGRWRTARVEQLYQSWGVHYPRSRARKDLKALATTGHLTVHGPDDGRFYTPNTRKDGQR